MANLTEHMEAKKPQEITSGKGLRVVCLYYVSACPLGCRLG